MKSYRRSLFEFSVAELDRELVARGAQVSEKRRFTFSHSRGTPQREAVMEQVRMMYREAPFPDRSLQYVGTEDLVKMIMARTRSTEGGRGIWNDQKMFDMFEIHDEVVRRNAEGVAAICLAEDLEAEGNGFFSLETGHYGELFNLCVCEPFHGQPVVMGPLFTGFLVSPDIIVTAGHCVHEGNIGALRVIFSFKMSEPFSAATRVSEDQVYRCEKIIGRVYDREGNGTDWAVVKLDRKVLGRPVARLSAKKISPDQPVYVLGHPCGLPLKYASGSKVVEVSEAYFGADLNVYSGNSGSPVFDSESHEVVGMVVRGDNRDFRWSGECWLSVIYPVEGIKAVGPQCTRVSEFRDLCC